MPPASPKKDRPRRHRRRWRRRLRDPYFYDYAIRPYDPYYYNYGLPTQPIAVNVPPATEAPVVLPEQVTQQQWLTYGGIALGALIVGGLLVSMNRRKD